MDVAQGASRDDDEAPTPEEVSDLYAAATQGPPMYESRAQADAYADLFRYVLTRPDAAWVASVYLLVVHPSVQRQGRGRRLLAALLETAGATCAWLQTRDEPTPARELYGNAGWTDVGHGPDAPNGRPGLVLGFNLPY